MRTVKLKKKGNLRTAFTLSCALLVLVSGGMVVHAQDYPIMRYIEYHTMPPLPVEATRRGYVVFRTNYLDLVMRETIPSEEKIGQPLGAFASPGEYEPVGFAIRTLRDLEQLYVTATPLSGPGGAEIPTGRIDIRSVRYHLQKLWRSDIRMMYSPVWLEKRDHLDLGADLTQPFWVTIHVPEDAVPGVYNGLLTIHAKGSEPTDIELRLEVLPIDLLPVPDDYVIGMYDRVGPWGETDEELLAKYIDMREHGMTSVGYFGDLGLDIRVENERIVIDFTGKSDLERSIRAFHKAGLPGPFHWIMGKDIRDWAIEQAGSLESPRFGKYYRGAVEALVAHGKAMGWPEFIIQPEDEPFEYRHRWNSMIRSVQSLSSLPEIRIGEGGINANPKGFEEIFPLVDVFYFHDGPFVERGIYYAEQWEELRSRMQEENKTFWFYNCDHSGYHPEAGRFTYGFMIWETGAGGAFNWQYQGRKENAYEIVTGNSYHFTFRYPPVGDEPGGPTTQWEAQREGVDDLRYLLSWKKLAEEKRKDADPQTEEQIRGMEEQLDTWFEEIDYSAWRGGSVRGCWTTYAEDSPAFRGSYKMKGVWDLGRYNEIRRRIADWILILNEAD